MSKQVQWHCAPEFHVGKGDNVLAVRRRYTENASFGKWAEEIDYDYKSSN